MSKVEGASIIQNLQWRYATKRFDPKRKISPADWATLEQALVLSPSSYGLQPWKFFVVDDAKKRTTLQADSWGQSQIVDASHLVVFAIKRNLARADVERYIARIAAVRKIGTESLKDFQNMMLGMIENPAPGFDVNAWAARQVYIALGTLLTTAAMLGIDACPMEGFVPAKYDEILGLGAQGYGATVLCTLGYRSADDSYASLPKVRFDRTEMVQHI